MPVFPVIQALLQAGKLAFDLVTGVKKKKEEDRRKVAELFDHIGKLLHDTYVELSAGRYPHGHCRQIEIFGEKIKSSFTKQLGNAEAEQLGNLLIEANQVEGLAAQLSSGTLPQSELIKLEESSGEFIAASKLILF